MANAATDKKKKEAQRAYMRAYSKRPDVKAKKRAYQKTPAQREYYRNYQNKRYNTDPEYRKNMIKMNLDYQKRKRNEKKKANKK